MTDNQKALNEIKEASQDAAKLLKLYTYTLNELESENRKLREGFEKDLKRLVEEKEELVKQLKRKNEDVEFIKSSLCKMAKNGELMSYSAEGHETAITMLKILFH